MIPYIYLVIYSQFVFNTIYFFKMSSLDRINNVNKIDIYYVIFQLRIQFVDYTIKI